MISCSKLWDKIELVGHVSLQGSDALYSLGHCTAAILKLFYFYGAGKLGFATLDPELRRCQLPN